MTIIYIEERGGIIMKQYFMLISTFILTITLLFTTLYNADIEENNVDEHIYVTLYGQVYNPGMYKVKKNIYVFEVINHAGGFTNYADKTKIDLSRQLKQNETIIISEYSDFCSDGRIRINTVDIYTLSLYVQEFAIEELFEVEKYRVSNGSITNIEDLSLLLISSNNLATRLSNIDAKICYI